MKLLSRMAARITYNMSEAIPGLAFKNFNEIDVPDITRDPLLILIA